MNSSNLLRYNRAQRGSKVSSVNTEASITEEEEQEEQEAASKYKEEDGDTLADLNNIQKQTKAMGKLINSQMNVRSLSLSETNEHPMIYCSSMDISQVSEHGGNDSTMPITAQPASPTVLELYQE